MKKGLGNYIIITLLFNHNNYITIQLLLIVTVIKKKLINSNF